MEEIVRRNTVGGALLAAAIVLLAGCQAGAGDPEPTLTDPAPDVVPVEQEEPVAEEFVQIEGMGERIAVVRFQAPLEYPKDFLTVVPTDMVVDYATSGAGDVIRFEADFGGIRRPDAALSFTVLPEGTEPQEARATAIEIAREHGGTRHSPPLRSWALEEWQIAPAGFLALAHHGHRWFLFVASYPPEFEDGMAPRIELILRRWTFIDGTRLMDLE